MEEGFDCPVKFWGYYRLSETPVVAGLAQVICESDGSITLNGLESPSIITARQAAILSKTWMRVKALGKPERLSLRYELPIGFNPSRCVTPALAKEQMV
jgi:hypothetical protein